MNMFPGLLFDSSLSTSLQSSQIIDDCLNVLRFWKHVFDQPGDQTDDAVNCIVKAFKWRKEFGVEKLTESTINMSVINKGSLYSHNRDKVSHQHHHGSSFSPSSILRTAAS